LFGWLNTKIFGFFAIEHLKSKGDQILEIFSMHLWLVLSGLGFSIAISIIAGLYPAGRAAKLEPIEALRYE